MTTTTRLMEFHVSRMSAGSGDETIRIEMRESRIGGLTIRATMTPAQFALGLTARVVTGVDVELHEKKKP